MRFKAHLNLYNKEPHRHPKFYNFINKKGLKNKNFQILEADFSPELLKVKEQYWLDLIFNNYKDHCLNLLKFADSNKGIPTSDET